MSRHPISWLVLTSQVVSLLFSPFYLPVIAFAALFMFSYLNMLPLVTKLVLLLIVYFFTVALPHLFIFLYRRHSCSERAPMPRGSKVCNTASRRSSSSGVVSVLW